VVQKLGLVKMTMSKTVAGGFGMEHFLRITEVEARASGTIPSDAPSSNPVVMVLAFALTLPLREN
jgi:hypothetical protein